MAGTIGPLRADISASTDGLDPVLAQAVQLFQSMADASKKVNAKGGEDAGKGWALGFATSMKAGLASVGSLGMSLESIAERALGNPGRFITDNIFGAMANVAGRMPMLGPILSLPFEGLQAVGNAAMDTYEKGSERILSFGKAAQQAGVPLGDFQVIAETMGGDVDKASTMIDKVQRSLEEARGGALGASNVFSRLKLSPFDIRADLEGIGAINEAIKGLATDSAKAAAIRDLYGRTADKQFVNKGSAGLTKTAGLIESFGAGFGENDFASIRKAKEAQREIGFFWQGVTNQVTIGIAPILAELSDVMPKLSDMGITAKGLASTVVDIAEGVANVAALVVEMFTNPADALQDLQTVWLRLEALILDGVARVGDALVASILRPLGPTLARLGIAVAGIAGAPLGSSSPQQGLRDSANDLRRQAEERDVARGIDDELAFLSGEGRVSSQQKIGEFFDRVRDRMKETRDVAEQFNPFEVWADSLKKLDLQFQTPMEKMKKEFADFQSRISTPQGAFMGVDDAERGFEALQLQDKLKGRVGAKFLDELRSATGGGALGTAFVGASEAGSREAYSAVTAYTAQTETIEQEIGRRMEEANQIATRREEQGAKMIEYLEAIAEGVDDEGWE